MVDLTDEVVVLRRADGRMPMTSRIAVAKARTALLALRSSGLIKLPGGIVDSLQHLYGGDFVPWAGGVLVTDDDVIPGAAGASGAHAVEDEEAVQTAVRRWQETAPADGRACGEGAPQRRTLPLRGRRAGVGSVLDDDRPTARGWARQVVRAAGRSGWPPSEGAGWDRGACDGAGDPSLWSRRGPGP